MRILYLVVLSLIIPVKSMLGQLVISEVSPQSDWIEIRNDGSSDIDLNGYLINDEFDGDFWEFPSLNMTPGQHLLIEASGLDRNYLPENWQCPVVESDNWNYIIPLANSNDSWMLPGFTLLGWSSGPGGIGYSDGDDATVISNTNVVYIRKTFEVNDPDDWGYLSLAIDYDDGYIAYLNGVEISRSSTMTGVIGNIGDFANNNHEATMYSGGAPEQLVWAESEFSDWLVQGENVLAIKAFNVNATSSDLSIRPFLGLTPKDSEMTSWPAAPAWWPEMEGTLHTSFQLSTEELVVLKDPEGNVVSSLPIHPNLPANHSVGRSEGEDESWCIFETPSPGLSNAGQTCYLDIAPKPQVSVSSGWYASEVTVELLPQTAEDLIVRYTTNGDQPSTQSPAFPPNGLVLEETSSLTLKAWSANNDLLPSEIQDEIFIVDEFTPDLPTFSIFTDDHHLWDWNTGIYVFGPNAEDEYPHFGSNFWQPWSRPSRLMFFDETGTIQARETFDLEIHGGWSRAEPQRSFRLDFKNEYSGDFEWPLFSASPEVASFNNFNLRNGGQHSWATKFQDGLISTLANETHNFASAWQPAHLYLNGAYWGLYAAREKTDEHFIADHFGTDKDEVDLVGPFAVLSGSDAELYAAASLIQSTPTSSPSFFSTFAERFDVENYMDYFIFETYIQNTDWMGIAWGLNNVKTFRAGPEHPWRYLLYDTDASFGFFGASIWNNFIDYARNPGYPNIHSNLFDRVLNNTEFRLRFINRYADLVNTVFQPTEFNPRAAEAKNLIDDAMDHHIQRWDSPGSVATWLNAINAMTSHNSNRIGTSRQHLMDSFNLPESHECTLDAFPPTAGHVRINTIEPGPLPWEGVYFEQCPIEIEAISADGWMFDRWDVNSHVESGDMDAYLKTNEVALHSNDLYRARFEPCPEDATASISEAASGLEVVTTNVPYVDSIAWHLDGTWVGNGLTWWPSVGGSYMAVLYFDGCVAQTEPLFTDGMGIELAENSAPLIAPNPASERIWVSMDRPGSLEVFNALGQSVCTRTAFAQTNGLEMQIDVSQWPEGIYFMHSGPFVQKFIVRH